MLNLENKINFWDGYNSNIILDYANRSETWMGSDIQSTYLYTSKDPRNVTYEENDFLYKYNSHGFRSEEFDNSKDVKILYGGCSLTEGIGLPIEHTWHQFLNEKISAEIGKPIPNFNVGRGGIGIDAIVRLIYVTIEHNKFEPDLVCLLLPTVMRQEWITVDSKNNVGWLDYIPNFILSDKDPKNVIQYQNISKTTSYLQRYYDSFRNLIFLKWYLTYKKIPFFFGFWDNFTFTHPATKKEMKHRDIMLNECPIELKDHYISGGYILDKFCDQVQHVPKGWFQHKFKQTIARDGMHYGPNSHWNYINYFFYPALKNSKAFNDLLSKWKAKKEI